MSKQKISKLLGTVINEDAIEFKNSLSKILYEKVNHKLRKEYVRISQNLFENATMGTGVVGSSDSRSMGEFSQTPQTSFANQTMNTQQDDGKNITMAMGEPGFYEIPKGWDNLTPQQQQEYLFKWMRWYSTLSEQDKKTYDESSEGYWWIKKAREIVW